MEPTPDLRFYDAVHRKMRADTARFVVAVERLTVADGRRADALGRWATGFAAELLEHHHAEDEHLFPDLARRVPAARAVLARLDEDHRSLDETLVRWTAAARALAGRGAPFDGARAELLDVSVELRDHLRAHLDIEDADVLPLFARHYSVADYEAVQGAAVRDARTQGVAFYVPWIVDAVEGDVRATLMAEAPLRLKLLWHATRRRHARLVATAFAGATEPAPTSLRR